MPSPYSISYVSEHKLDTKVTWDIMKDRQQV